MRRLRTARGGGVVPKDLVALGHLLHDLRLFKSRDELALMRRSAEVAGRILSQAVTALERHTRRAARRRTRSA